MSEHPSRLPEEEKKELEAAGFEEHKGPEIQDGHNVVRNFEQVDKAGNPIMEFQVYVPKEHAEMLDTLDYATNKTEVLQEAVEAAGGYTQAIQRTFHEDGSVTEHSKKRNLKRNEAGIVKRQEREFVREYPKNAVASTTVELTIGGSTVTVSADAKVGTIGYTAKEDAKSLAREAESRRILSGAWGHLTIDAKTEPDALEKFKGLHFADSGQDHNGSWGQAKGEFAPKGGFEFEVNGRTLRVDSMKKISVNMDADGNVEKVTLHIGELSEALGE